MENGFKPSPQTEEFRENAIKQVYSSFMDHLLSDTVLKYHKDKALAASIGLTSESDEMMPVSSSSKDSVGVEIPGNKRNQIECECLCCHRMIAAARFAPHMEKCIGMGRNSSRVARRRLANMNTSGPPSASQSPRISTRISISSNLDGASSPAFDIEEELVEDDEWSNSSAPTKRRRTQLSSSTQSRTRDRTRTSRQTDTGERRRR